MSGGELPASAQRVQREADRRGLAITVRIMDRPTRTAEEAAQACGCTIGQIVKSLVFRGARSGRDYLVLVSGKNRVDQAGIAEVLGEELERPQADHVRAVTGFAIGGIPPFGHDTSLATYMDEDLLAFAEIWAAAGTPNAVFACEPSALRAAASASAIRVV